MEHDFQQVTERHGPTLYRLAYSYCGNRSDAEDCVQEVFVKYLTCGKVFEDDEHRLRWLMKVTANQCRDLLKSGWKQKRQTLETLPDIAAPQADPDTRLAVRQAIEALPPKDRGIVYLYYYESYPVRRIAASLGLSETAVRSRLDRARKRLRQMLGGESG